MIEIRILYRCETCAGEAYIFEYQEADYHGETYDLYQPFEICQSSSNLSKWVDLSFLRFPLPEVQGLERTGTGFSLQS